MAEHSVEGTLDRHRIRRSQLLPTISVLAGPIGLGLRRWKAWTGRHNIETVQSSACREADLVRDWCVGVAESHNLIDEAIRRLLPSTHDKNPEELARRLAAQTRYDFDRFWGGLHLDAQQPATMLCRALLTRHASNERLDPAQLTSEVFLGEELPWASTLTAMVELLSPTRSPALLVVPPPSPTEAANRFAGAARALVRVAAAVPQLTLGIAVPSETAEEFLKQESHSRTATILREGSVAIEGLSADELAARIEGVNAERVPPTLVRRLAKEGASEELAAALVDAAQDAFHPPATPEREDEARSAAERFLFELLEAFPDTAGLFKLNRPLEFRFGRKTAEADLLAEDLRLVVELDGAYYHLSDRAAYRRDRRKDLEYQRHGYYVLRFLSEDVFPHLEEITATIRQAVAHRRATHSFTGVPT